MKQYWAGDDIPEATTTVEASTDEQLARLAVMVGGMTARGDVVMPRTSRNFNEKQVHGGRLTGNR